jgi:hypothetical protein
MVRTQGKEVRVAAYGGTVARRERTLMLLAAATLTHMEDMEGATSPRRTIFPDERH